MSARQLDLQTESVRKGSVADGRTATVPYVGPVKVAFGKRFCYVGALVIGEEVLLGSVPMEDMDLVVNPRPPAANGRSGQSRRPPRPCQIGAMSRPGAWMKPWN